MLHSVFLPPFVCQDSCSSWSVPRIKSHDPADEVPVVSANFLVRDVFEWSPAVLKILQHPQNKLHHVVAGDLLVFEWERAKELNLSL